MRDYVILDTVVDLAGDYAALQQVLLGAIGPEAHNASGPARRHAGRLQQLIHAGVIDVDALLRRRGFCRCYRQAASFPILVEASSVREGTPTMMLVAPLDWPNGLPAEVPVATPSPSHSAARADNPLEPAAA